MPGEPAAGYVQFTNLTDQTVEIPVGTVVRTLDIDAVRFVVTEEGQLEPSPLEKLRVGEQRLGGAVGDDPALIDHQRSFAHVEYQVQVVRCADACLLERAEDFDQPTIIRNRNKAAQRAQAAAGNSAEDLDYLDIPAFLRRQAD